MELTLVAGAFKDVPFFMVIESAAQVGAFAGQGPALVVAIKDDKLICGEEARLGNRFVDVYVNWLFGELEPGKPEHRIKNSHSGKPYETRSSGYSLFMRLQRLIHGKLLAKVLISISLTCGGTRSLTSPPFLAASLIIEELM